MFSALLHLPRRGLAHDGLSLDKVMVDTDGHCRLTRKSAKHAREREIFKSLCYLSLAMAVGALPTPQCDMFCYRLLAIEAVTQKPC
ncbi:hypothetical protein, conserved [Leishmania lindenbergi]|uniref:Uncharacterized protein n=1 Tax=Leishmania lindenbergi TaxID=651832 RepID=A0AAW3AZ94_9TRYP